MKKNLLLFILTLSTLIASSQGLVNNRNNVEQSRLQKAAIQQKAAILLATGSVAGGKTPPKGAHTSGLVSDTTGTTSAGSSPGTPKEPILVDTPTNFYLSLFRYNKYRLSVVKKKIGKSNNTMLYHHSTSTQDSNLVKTYFHLNDSLIIYQAKADWYQHQYDTFVYERGTFRWWLPTTTRAMRAATFTNYARSQSDFNVINQVQFQAQQGTASLYAELLGTNIGHFRISFGSLIAANNDSSVQQQTLQSFLAGGGNAVLNGYYPLIYVRSDFFTLLWEYSPKIGGQIPGMGTYNNNVTGNAQLIASDIYMDFDSFDNTLGIYGFLRGAYTFGSNDFYDNLQIPRHMFGYLQLNAGMVINQNVRISVSGPIASTTGSLLRAPWQIGVQLMPVSAKK